MRLIERRYQMPVEVWGLGDNTLDINYPAPDVAQCCAFQTSPRQYRDLLLFEIQHQILGQPENNGLAHLLGDVQLFFHNEKRRPEDKSFNLAISSNFTRK